MHTCRPGAAARTIPDPAKTKQSNLGKRLLAAFPSPDLLAPWVKGKRGFPMPELLAPWVRGNQVHTVHTLKWKSKWQKTRKRKLNVHLQILLASIASTDKLIHAMYSAQCCRLVSTHRRSRDGIVRSPLVMKNNVPKLVSRSRPKIVKRKHLYRLFLAIDQRRPQSVHEWAASKPLIS